MSASIDQILLFIEQEPQYAILLIALVAFLESLAVVGVLVPGWLLLVGIGTLVGSGVLSFYPICLSMFVGAVLGEGLSYWLGDYYKDRIRQWRFFERHSRLLSTADTFFEKYGVLSLIIGRFIGPLRALLPVVAGISGLPKKVFWLVNVVSGLFWAPLYLMPGIMVGASLQLSSMHKEQLLIMLFAAVVFAWLSRKEWLNYRKTSQAAHRLRCFLSVSCTVIVIVIFSLSESGQAVFTLLSNVLKLS